MNTQNDLETMLKQSLTSAAATSASGKWAGLVHPELSHAIVGAAIEVHRRIGPGQLESVYQRSLACELRYRAIPFEAQVPIAMLYRGESVGEFWADFIVDNKIIIELKAVERFHPAHTAQVLSYLRATKLHLGLLLQRGDARAGRTAHRAVSDQRISRRTPRHSTGTLKLMRSPSRKSAARRYESTCAMCTG